MSLRATINSANRAELMAAVESARIGARLELIDDPRTLAQNRKMWVLLNELSVQLVHCGNRYPAEDWKCAFLKAMGKQMAFMPGLDGDGVVAIGYSSSRLRKDEMNEMIERIYEYGARHGVKFNDIAGTPT